VVAVSPGYIDQLSERFAGLKPLEQYRLIRNGQDLPDDIIEQSLKLPHNRQVRIHYNGTVQQARPFELILGLLDRLPREQRPWFTFPALSPQVRDEVAARGLQQWVTELGLMSYRQGLEHCLMSDVLLNLTNRAPEYHATIPAKVYEAIALGRHLLSIGPPGSAVGPLIEECNNGTLVDGSDAEAIDHAIRRIVEQHRSGSLNADQDPVRRRALAEKYSRRQQTRELVQVLDGLVSRAPASSQYSVKASQHQAIRD
jgi:glycosyltransferase involved in cell wall biosynthesis